MRSILAALLALVAAAIVAVYLSFFIVHQNEQALVLEFGKPVRIVEKPGLNWKLPVVQTVTTFDKRILDLDTTPDEVTASDQKRLRVDAFTRFKIVDPLKFYQAVNNQEGARRTLGPIVNSSLKRVLASVTFQDIVRDKREELMKRIAKQVNEEGKDLGVEVVDVRIKRADLPQQNSKSVFDRMRAERQREAAEFRAQGSAEANRIRATADREATVIKGEAMRKSELLRGEGDAERNKVFAEAYGRDAEFFRFYRQMQAYEAGIKPGTRMLLSPDSEFFRYLTNPNALATPKR
ncbi:MAG: protease modulator HflC [Hyphomicrobiaceae bacterium]